MAKVAFSKLGLTKNTEVIEVEWKDQKIEVKDYLPIEDKLTLVQKILNESVDENGYYNPARIHLFTIVEVVLAYSNISVTEKQREDLYKLYDLFVSSGFSGQIIGSMNPSEYKLINQWVSQMIANIYEYKNSVYGVLDTINTDYKDMDLNITKLTDNLSNPDNLTLLKETLTKLG